MRLNRRMNSRKRYSNNNMNKISTCNTESAPEPVSEPKEFTMQNLESEVSACLELFLMYEKNYEYMKSLYPMIVRKVQMVVDEECDKLEHTGSCMYDEWPDKIHLDSIIDTIYEQLKDLDNDNPELQAEELIANPLTALEARYHEPVEATAINPIPDYTRLGRPNWYRNMIASLFYNEMLYRRMRYYNRRYF